MLAVTLSSFALASIAAATYDAARAISAIHALNALSTLPAPTPSPAPSPTQKFGGEDTQDIHGINNLAHTLARIGPMLTPAERTPEAAHRRDMARRIVSVL